MGRGREVRLRVRCEITSKDIGETMGEIEERIMAYHISTVRAPY